MGERGERVVMHIAARVIRGEPAFIDDEAREVYLHLVKRYFRSAGVSVVFFVVMSGHAHWEPFGEPLAISAAMRDSHRDFAKWFNKRIGEQGHLFQGRFFRRLIEDERDLLTTTRYLAWNAPKAGICATPADYPWSADSAYRQGRCVFPIDTTLVLAALGGSDPRESYSRLVDRPPHGLSHTLQITQAAGEFAINLGTTTRALLASRDPDLAEARRKLVRQLREKGNSIEVLAKALGLSRHTIWRLSSDK